MALPHNSKAVGLCVSVCVCVDVLPVSSAEYPNVNTFRTKSVFSHVPGQEIGEYSGRGHLDTADYCS